MEYSDYLDKLAIEKNEKFFKSYVKIPLIIAIIIGVAFFIWGLVDATTFQEIVYKKINGKNVKIMLYGFLKVESRIGAVIIWWLMGAVVSIGSYFLLKILFSPKILSVLYLRKIKQDLDKIVFSKEVKENKQQPIEINGWVCPHCGETNNKDAKRCGKCFTVKA